MKYDVVISTLNRPDSLTACLNLIEHQSEKPNRVIVVDASDDHEAVRSRALHGRDQSIDWLFLQADQKNLPHQRNLGLAHVTSDVVLLPDDDSMLYPHAAEEMMAAYRLDQEGLIAGVSGTSVGAPPEGRGTVVKTRGRELKERIQPARNRFEDRVFPKPFNSYPRELWRARAVPAWVDGTRFVRVECIGGYLLSLRADLAKRYGFDATLGYGIGYALHEDLEMSMRLQREGFTLVAALNAPIFHDFYPSKRAGGFNYGFCWILNYVYVCSRDIPAESAARTDDLERYLRYKLGLYKARAMARRDEYSRDVYEGAKAAWEIRGSLASDDLAGLTGAYRSACDTYIRQSRSTATDSGVRQSA